MKEIKLTKGFFALVDDEDFEYLNKFKWNCKVNKHTKYAYGTISLNGKKHITTMHSLILGIVEVDNIFADHIDHNGLNNQKHNLRKATRAENNSYKTSAKNSTSKYLGVSFCKQTNKWRATIYKNYKQINLGRYSTQEAAAAAYNQKAKEIHGEFANLNIISI